MIWSTKTWAAILGVMLLLIGIYVVFYSGCGDSIGDVDLARSVLDGQIDASDLQFIRLEVPLKNKTHTIEFTDDIEIQNILGKMKSRRGELLGNIKYTEGVVPTFSLHDGRECSLEFADDNGVWDGVFLGDACREYQEIGWQTPAADLYAWIIQEAIDKKRDGQESELVDD